MRRTSPMKVRMRNTAAASHLALPRHWSRSVQATLVRVMALAQYALAYTRSWSAVHGNARVRLAAQADRAQQEARGGAPAGGMRIKDARLARIPAAQRPH